MRLRVLRIPSLGRDHPYIVVAKVRRGPVLVCAFPGWKAIPCLKALTYGLTMSRKVSRWRHPPNLATFPQPCPEEVPA